MLLASVYPFLFIVVAWLFVLFPIYPGLIVMAFGALSVGPRTRLTLLLVGAGLFALGLLVVLWNWDSFRHGNPYNLW